MIEQALLGVDRKYTSEYTLTNNIISANIIMALLIKGHAVTVQYLDTHSAIISSVTVHNAKQRLPTDTALSGRVVPGPT